MTSQAGGGSGTVLLLSHFPPHHVLYARALVKLGARVVGVGDATEIPDDLRGALAEYVHLADLGDRDALGSIARGLVNRHGPLVHIDSLSEHWLGAEAALRDDLGVAGLSSANTRAIRTKLGMFERLVAAGLPAIPTAAGSDPEAVRALALKEGFPLVAKPDHGAGAAGTHRILDQADLERRLPELTAHVVQPFVKGVLTSFDGLVDRDHRILHTSSLVYRDPVLDIVEGSLDVLFWTRRTIPPALDTLGRAVVAAFELSARFFHIEAFELENGRFMPLEINARPPGGYCVDMMNYGSDVDLYDRWARVVLAADADRSPPEAPFHVAHVGRRAAKPYTLDEAAARARAGAMVVASPEPPPMIGDAMGKPIWLVRHEDEATMLAAARDILG